MSAYEKAVEALLKEDGVELSTMMKTPCLRYRGNFLGMMFDKEDALIIKVSPERVLELMDQGVGREFNFTKKRFKEWVLIGAEFQEDYEGYLREALAYSRL
ncbi:hypothetical protein RYZ26_13900 [Terasakiella sp. A23]|uniref:hypothetical protein n=1 Tax=Terasakiella sp. FCG-A23 TaxID=3080561 RepID=UPI002953C8B9|nr:hypothetical protein [Terasakiella sp. A23]MDV7340694.1 hypothetical protein [Terasakiella sp. A23]